MSHILEITPPEDLIDLGDGHWALPVTCAAHPEEGTTGYIEGHKRPDDGTDCEGSVMLKGHGHGKRADGSNIPEWERVKDSPLTLTPSVLCTDCGAHGWIKDGKWKDA